MSSFPPCQYRGSGGSSRCWCHKSDSPVWVSKIDCLACPFSNKTTIESAAIIERKSWRIGDKIARGLSAVGITKERVSRVLGRPCGCKERQEAVNKIGDAVQDAIFGK